MMTVIRVGGQHAQGGQHAEVVNMEMVVKVQIQLTVRW